MKVQIKMKPIMNEHALITDWTDIHHIHRIIEDLNVILDCLDVNEMLIGPIAAAQINIAATAIKCAESELTKLATETRNQLSSMIKALECLAGEEAV